MTDPQNFQEKGEKFISFENEIKDGNVNQAQIINNTYTGSDTNKGQYFHQAQTINNSYLDSATRKDLRIRGQLLKRLQNDVKDRLESTLHEWVKLDLQTEDQMHQICQGRVSYAMVAKDSETTIGENLLTEEPIKQIENILKIFDHEDTQGKLLILGEPGSGKTTELITLAKELLQRAVSDRSEPLAVVLDLMTWKKDISIRDWIVKKLNEIYNLDEKRSQDWIAQERIIPLLDGLDELGLVQQNECIKSINHFVGRQCLGRIVVCCRKEDYEVGEEKLIQMKAAIYLKPLETEQIKDYLNRLGRGRLWQPFCQMPELLELTRVPLFLNFLILSYKGEPISKSAELLEIFVAKQLSGGSGQGVYPPSKRMLPLQTKRYLKILAENLESTSKADFLIEDIQPSWLSSSKERRMLQFMLASMLLLFSFSTAIPQFGTAASPYNLFSVAELIPLVFASVLLGFSPNPVMPFKKGALRGLFLGLGIVFLKTVAYEISEWPNGEFEFLADKIFFVIVRLLLTWIVGGLYFGGLEGVSWGLQLSRLFRSTDKFAFSFRRGVIGWMCGGVAFSISFMVYEANQAIEIGVVKYVVNALLIGIVLIGPLTGFLASIQALEIQQKTFSNQAVWLSARNSIAISLVVLVLSGWPAYFAAASSTDYDFISAMTMLLPFSIYACMYSGMGFVLRHFSIRLTLYFNKKLPWNYKRFLAHAEGLRFIQRVGGRYRFTHGLLRQYFSEIEV